MDQVTIISWHDMLSRYHHFDTFEYESIYQFLISEMKLYGAQLNQILEDDIKTNLKHFSTIVGMFL